MQNNSVRVRPRIFFHPHTYSGNENLHRRLDTSKMASLDFYLILKPEAPLQLHNTDTSLFEREMKTKTC